MYPQEIPIPDEDIPLQRALRAMGCEMKTLGGGHDAVVLQLHGELQGRPNPKVPHSMESLRRLLKTKRWTSLQEVHQWMVQSQTKVDRNPDWAAVIAAIEGDELEA